MTDTIHFQLTFLPDASEPVYLVGGSVRDLLAGHAPADIDLVTAGDIRRIATRIAARTGGTIVDLGNKGFDVLRVASPEVSVDITPLDGADIESDLRQRDFTVNAMAWDIHSHKLVDCTGGLTDLRQQTIRMVSPAAFENDPARLVRAYRLSATLNFSIAASTREAIARHCRRIADVASERVWTELTKLLATDRSAPLIRDMAATGLLTAIFPELAPAVGCIQNRHHEFDVFEHTLRACAHLEELLVDFSSRFPFAAGAAETVGVSGHAAILKYACLLHDAGKPAARTMDAEGNVHFYGHAAKSAAIAAGAGRRLRLSRKQRQVADKIIRYHLRPLFLFQAFENGSLGRRGMTRFFTRCGDLTLPIVVHTMADIMAKGSVLDGRNERFINFCSDLMKGYSAYLDRRTALPPLISGHDLKSVLGLAPSPLFTLILKQVDERRLSGELETSDQALKWVRAFLKRRSENRRGEMEGGTSNSEP